VADIACSCAAEARDVAEPVLLVEHEVVEAGEAQDLGDLRAAQHGPASEHVLALAQAFFKTFGRYN
jgi:hypothetical protein